MILSRSQSSSVLGIVTGILGTGGILGGILVSLLKFPGTRAVVAAQSLGIGSCYIGDILENYEVNRELFNLPQYVLPYILLVFGKPTQQQMDREKPKRFDLEDIVYQNQYKQKNIDELTSMIQNRIHKDDIESYVQAFAKRKFYAEFREEMNRSVRAMLDSWMK